MPSQDANVPGLKNIGNTCFLNAVLQALASSEEVVQQLHRTTSLYSSNEVPLVSALSDCLSALNDNSKRRRKSITPKPVINAFRQYISVDCLRDGEQNDSAEVLELICSTVATELSKQSNQSQHRLQHAQYPWKFIPDLLSASFSGKHIAPACNAAGDSATAELASDNSHGAALDSSSSSSSSSTDSSSTSDSESQMHDFSRSDLQSQQGHLGRPPLEGSTVNDMMCTTCQYSFTSQHSPFYVLPLALPTATVSAGQLGSRTVVAGGANLQRCLADLCGLELVQGVHCPRCTLRAAMQPKQPRKLSSVPEAGKSPAASLTAAPSERPAGESPATSSKQAHASPETPPLKAEGASAGGGGANMPQPATATAHSEAARPTASTASDLQSSHSQKATPTVQDSPEPTPSQQQKKKVKVIKGQKGKSSTRRVVKRRQGEASAEKGTNRQPEKPSEEKASTGPQKSSAIKITDGQDGESSAQEALQGQQEESSANQGVLGQQGTSSASKVVKGQQGRLPARKVTKGQLAARKVIKGLLQTRAPWPDMDYEQLAKDASLKWAPAGSLCVKRISLGLPPQALCLHLRRAFWTNTGHQVKLSGHIPFPLTLDASPYSAAKLPPLTSVGRQYTPDVSQTQWMGTGSADTDSKRPEASGNKAAPGSGNSAQSLKQAKAVSASGGSDGVKSSQADGKIPARHTGVQEANGDQQPLSDAPAAAAKASPNTSDAPAKAADAAQDASNAPAVAAEATQGAGQDAAAQEGSPECPPASAAPVTAAQTLQNSQQDAAQEGTSDSPFASAKAGPGQDAAEEGSPDNPHASAKAGPVQRLLASHALTIASSMTSGTSLLDDEAANDAADPTAIPSAAIEPFEQEAPSRDGDVDPSSSHTAHDAAHAHAAANAHAGAVQAQAGSNKKEQHPASFPHTRRSSSRASPCPTEPVDTAEGDGEVKGKADSSPRRMPVYHLTAAVVHHGGTSGFGHYTAFRRVVSEQKPGSSLHAEVRWFSSSDESVREVEVSDVLACEATLLMYEQSSL